MRPFLDAYSGPFKNKYRFWFGVRLWITVILYSIDGALQGTNINTMLTLQFAIIAAFVLFQNHLRPFKNYLIGSVDIFFMINYMGLIFSFLLIQSLFLPIYILLLSMALLILLLIVLGHCWICLRHIPIINKLKTRLGRKNGIINDTSDEDNDADEHLFEAVYDRPNLMVYDTY